jgi:chromosome segregation ATPase
MSSLFNSMAGAATKAMEGAALGHAIGSANDRADHAENQLDIWYKHAKMLEVKVLELEAKLQSSEKERNSLAQQLSAKEKQFEKFKGIATNAMNDQTSALSQNTDYGREIKKRLNQIQKGLQHSSADVESLTFMLKVYQDLFGDFSQLLSKGSIDEGTKVAAEAVWSAFMQGDKLTNNPEIQKLIDQAPMPMKTPRVIF